MVFAPAGHLKMPDTLVSQWGCKPDMLQAGFEYGCVGNLRYTLKGSREIACVHYDEFIEVSARIADKTGKTFPTFSEKLSVPDFVETVMMSWFTESGSD